MGLWVVGRSLGTTFGALGWKDGGGFCGGLVGRPFGRL